MSTLYLVGETFEDARATNAASLLGAKIAAGRWGLTKVFDQNGVIVAQVGKPRDWYVPEREYEPEPAGAHPFFTVILIVLSFGLGWLIGGHL